MSNKNDIPELVIYVTNNHDDATATLNGEVLFSNDHGFENVVLTADHLGWNWSIVILSRDEYETLEI